MSPAALASGTLPPLCFCRIGKPVPCNNPEHRLRYISHQVLRRRLPLFTSIESKSYGAADRVRVGSGEDVRTTLKGFRTLRDLANRHIWDAQQTGFLLDGSAV